MPKTIEFALECALYNVRIYNANTVAVGRRNIVTTIFCFYL